MIPIEASGECVDGSGRGTFRLEPDGLVVRAPCHRRQRYPNSRIPLDVVLARKKRAIDARGVVRFYFKVILPASLLSGALYLASSRRLVSALSEWMVMLPVIVAVVVFVALFPGRLARFRTALAVRLDSLGLEDPRLPREMWNDSNICFQTWALWYDEENRETLDEMIRALEAHPRLDA